jgi:Bacterial PH domain
MSDRDDVTVFRAPMNRRLVAGVGIVVLLVLAGRVVYSFGLLRSVIGVIFALAIIGLLWWSVLRPRLTADRSGVEVVNGRAPQRVAWTDIQRTEVGPKGTLIVAKGGHEILSRVPFGVRSESSATEQTEADRVAIFLAARTTWARRRDNSPPPKYTPPAAQPRP